MTTAGFVLETVLVTLAQALFVLCCGWTCVLGLYVACRLWKGRQVRVWPDGQLDRAPAAGCESTNLRLVVGEAGTPRAGRRVGSTGGEQREWSR